MWNTSSSANVKWIYGICLNLEFLMDIFKKESNVKVIQKIHKVIQLLRNIKNTVNVMGSQLKNTKTTPSNKNQITTPPQKRNLQHYLSTTKAMTSIYLLKAKGVKVESVRGDSI